MYICICLCVNVHTNRYVHTYMPHVAHSKHLGSCQLETSFCGQPQETLQFSMTPTAQMRARDALGNGELMGGAELQPRPDAHWMRNSCFAPHMVWLVKAATNHELGCCCLRQST